MYIYCIEKCTATFLCNNSLRGCWKKNKEVVARACTICKTFTQSWNTCKRRKRSCTWLQHGYQQRSLHVRGEGDLLWNLLSPFSHNNDLLWKGFLLRFISFSLWSNIVLNNSFFLPHFCPQNFVNILNLDSGRQKMLNQDLTTARYCTLEQAALTNLFPITSVTL